MPTLSNGIVYQDLGTHDAAEYAEYARQERERRRQAQQNAAPSPQPAPQQNSIPKTVPDRGPDVKTAPSAPMDAAEQTRRSQLQEGARSAYENYLGSYASQAQNEEKNIAQTGKSVMDTAYVFNEAWNAVKNNTAFAGNIEQQQAFVTNAAISFANASAVAHGWELVDQANVDGKNAWTGYNSQTGTWDFVFRDKNGNFFTKHTTMDQVASQLKNNGYYPDDADKSKDKGGKGGDEASASTGKGGETKPPAEQSYNDYDKRYGGFYTDTFDENGKKTGTRLTDEGETLMLEELKTATGRERTYLLNQLAWKQAHEAFADDQKNGNPQNRKFENEKDAFKSALESLKNEYADPASQKPNETNAAPDDALEAFAKSVSVGKTGDADIQYSGLGASWKNLDDARNKRKADAAKAAGERSVYYNGRWIQAKDLPKDAKTTGVIKGVNDVSPEAIESRRIAQEMTKANYEKNRPQEPLVSDDERVKGLDDILSRHGREDEEAYDRQNADYFDKDGGQIDPSEVTKDANGNLVDKNGDPVRKEIWDDGTGGVATSVEGDRVRRDWSGHSDTQSKRNAEVFDAVMQMSPETRRRLAEETDGRGNLTERAKTIRNAILDYVDNENKRDSEAAIHQNGAVQNSDGSFSRTYRDSKGGLVMEETFGSDRLTEQGREARLNALLDAELGPGGFADTRSYAQRTEAENAERVAREESDRVRDANNARISDERSTADSEAASAVQAMQDKGVGRVRSQKWKDEQTAKENELHSSLLTPDEEAQAREIVSRWDDETATDEDRARLLWPEGGWRLNSINTDSLGYYQEGTDRRAFVPLPKELHLPEDRDDDDPKTREIIARRFVWAKNHFKDYVPEGEPADSEPENKPSGPAPLPDNPKERRSAVKKDKNYGSIVESANANGTYTLTDSAIAKLEEKGLTTRDMTPERIENWIHFGDEYLDKHAELKKRIASNQAAEDERGRMQRAEHERQRKEEQERINRRSRVANKISERGGDFANASDEKLRRMFPDKRDYEIAVQIRAQKKKYAKTVR